MGSLHAKLFLDADDTDSLYSLLESGSSVGVEDTLGSARIVFVNHMLRRGEYE